MKFGKKILVITLIITIAISNLLVACKSKDTSTSIPSDKNKLKVGLVLSTGGKGDKSFNDLASDGLIRAKAELGIEYKESQPKEIAEIEKYLEFYAKNKYDVVFGISFLMRDVFEKVAKKYKSTKFVIIDSDCDPAIENAIGVKFKDNEAAFLAGALAGQMTKSNVIGFVGGMDVPIINNFEAGFKEGLKQVNNNANLVVKYVGTDSTAFNNPDKAKEIAFNLVDNNADILVHAAGGSGDGVLEAAKVKGIKAIGADKNQNMFKSGIVIASMLKKIDTAIFEIIESIINNSFKGGETRVLGLAEDGVGITDLTNLTREELDGTTQEDQKLIKQAKDSIPQSVKDKIEELRKKVVNGEIKVPYLMDYNKTQK